MRKSRYLGKRYVDAFLNLCTSLTLAMRLTGFLCRILALVSAITYSRKEGPGPLSSLTAARLPRGQDSGIFGLRWGMKLVIKGRPDRCAVATVA